MLYKPNVILVWHNITSCPNFMHNVFYQYVVLDLMSSFILFDFGSPGRNVSTIYLKALSLYCHVLWRWSFCFLARKTVMLDTDFVSYSDYRHTIISQDLSFRSAGLFKMKFCPCDTNVALCFQSFVTGKKSKCLHMIFVVEVSVMVCVLSITIKCTEKECDCVAGSGGMDQTCVRPSDCYANGTVCYQGQCVCDPEFIFDKPTHACVRSESSCHVQL